MTSEIGKGKTSGRAKRIVRWICSFVTEIESFTWPLPVILPSDVGGDGIAGRKSCVF